MNKPHRIVIAGGGTAGWMAASMLHHEWQHKGVEIILVESPQIGIIGVGEGSTPSLKHFFSHLGIAESEWMPACHATYKVNIQFNDWSPASGIEHYSHPFISQVDTFTENHLYTNCYTRRLGLDVETQPEKFLLNGVLAAQNKLPITPDNFPFVVEYGYHFDSALLGQFLAKRTVEKGCEHIQAKIEEVVLAPQGHITHLVLDNGQRVEGDFFIDCTGFDSLLLQRALDVKFESFADNLFNDAAVAMPSAVQQNIELQTQASAMTAGWAWQIPLTHRTGNGYVYSSSYISAEQAEHELRQRLGLLDDDVPVKHLRMKVGQVKQHWQKNCLAIGLSQGFIEPLEATALHLVQTTVESFMHAYDAGQFSNQQQDAFNQEVTERYERVRDYIVAHYKLNTRQDSAYWRDNRNNMKLSQPLLQLLDVWFKQGDLAAEIKRQNADSHFAATSWHCLLAGYGTFPRLAAEQPGQGCMYQQHSVEQFLNRCALNFSDPQ